MDTIAQLLDETKFYWALLHTAVRLDRRWSPNLDAQYAEAEQDALSLGRQVARGARRVATLEDLRALSVERIEDTLERLSYALAMASEESATLDLVRRRLGDVERLVGRLDYDSELTKDVCADAEGLLEECLKACRAGGRAAAAGSVATVSG